MDPENGGPKNVNEKNARLKKQDWKMKDQVKTDFIA